MVRDHDESGRRCVRTLRSMQDGHSTSARGERALSPRAPSRLRRNTCRGVSKGQAGISIRNSHHPGRSCTLRRLITAGLADYLHDAGVAAGCSRPDVSGEAYRFARAAALEKRSRLSEGQAHGGRHLSVALQPLAAENYDLGLGIRNGRKSPFQGTDRASELRTSRRDRRTYILLPSPGLVRGRAVDKGGAQVGRAGAATWTRARRTLRQEPWPGSLALPSAPVATRDAIAQFREALDFLDPNFGHGLTSMLWT